MRKIKRDLGQNKKRATSDQRRSDQGKAAGRAARRLCLWTAAASTPLMPSQTGRPAVIVTSNIAKRFDRERLTVERHAIALARKVLGWEPKVDRRAGLAKTIEYCKTLPADVLAKAGGGKVITAG